MLSRKSKQTISVSAGAIGLLLILVVLVVMYQRNRFVTYDNTTDGYSIGYPISWSYEENEGGASVVFISPQESGLDQFKENLNVVIQDISKKQWALKDYSQLAIEQLEAVFQNNMKTEESVDTYLSGLPAHRIVFSVKGDQTDFKFMSIWAIQGGRAYQITFSAPISRYQNFIGKVNKMVASFKLL